MPYTGTRMLTQARDTPRFERNSSIAPHLLATRERSVVVRGAIDTLRAILTVEWTGVRRLCDDRRDAPQVKRKSYVPHHDRYNSKQTYITNINIQKLFYNGYIQSNGADGGPIDTAPWLVTPDTLRRNPPLPCHEPRPLVAQHGNGSYRRRVRAAGGRHHTRLSTGSAVCTDSVGSHNRS